MRLLCLLLLTCFVVAQYDGPSMPQENSGYPADNSELVPPPTYGISGNQLEYQQGDEAEPQIADDARKMPAPKPKKKPKKKKKNLKLSQKQKVNVKGAYIQTRVIVPTIITIHRVLPATPPPSKPAPYYPASAPAPAPNYPAPAPAPAPYYPAPAPAPAPYYPPEQDAPAEEKPSDDGPAAQEPYKTL